jgi:DUF1365 family protein
MQPHVVTVTRNHHGADQDGGHRIASSSDVVGLRCFVQPGEARTVITTDDQTGLNRVTEFNPTKIYFVDDAALKIQDVIAWVDAASRTHTYVVLGYYPPCGTNVMWNAVCQEQI